MITPLHAKRLTGEAYERMPEVEAKLREIENLPRDELIARFEITSRADPAYLPTECLVYHVRASSRDNSSRGFDRLYRLLLERFMRLLPRAKNANGETSVTRDAIGNAVVGRFNELLATDRQIYNEKLDFFEVHFEQAVARRRDDAKKKAWRHENRSQPLTNDEETGELSQEVEEAAGTLKFDPFEKIQDRDYRRRLHAAIDELPKHQARILQMLAEDIPIDSKAPGAVTIAKVLGKAEKTIRLQRDKALKTLRYKLLGDEK